MDRYSTYKNSGVEWLGEIPIHWEVQRVKYVFLLQRGYDLSSEEIEAGKYPVYASNGIIGWHKDFNVKAPSITVGRSGSVGEVNYVSSDFWAHNTALFVKHFFNSFPKFIFYLLLALDTKRLSAGSAVGTLNRNYIHDLFIAVPPISEQRSIAHYLDHQTAKIDTLITAKQRLLKLLTEKRRALITHAVTRGLNPQAALRDSGVEWLGEIPIHWSLEKLKYHLTGIEQGWSPQSDSFPADKDEWGVLKVGAVNGWEFNPSENKRLPPELEPLPEYEIKPGDILISRANTTELLGSASLVEQVRPN